MIKPNLNLPKVVGLTALLALGAYEGSRLATNQPTLTEEAYNAVKDRITGTGQETENAMSAEEAYAKAKMDLDNFKFVKESLAEDVKLLNNLSFETACAIYDIDPDDPYAQQEIECRKTDVAKSMAGIYFSLRQDKDNLKPENVNILIGGPDNIVFKSLCAIYDVDQNSDANQLIGELILAKAARAEESSEKGTTQLVLAFPDSIYAQYGVTPPNANDTRVDSVSKETDVITAQLNDLIKSVRR